MSRTKGPSIDSRRTLARAKALAKNPPAAIAGLTAALAAGPPPPTPGSHLVYVDASSGGLLYAGMTPYSLDDVARIGACCSVVVDLMTSEDRTKHPVQQYTEESIGATVWREPIPDMKVISESAITALAAAIAGEIVAGKRVYVHCRGGLGRAGIVCGAAVSVLQRGLTLPEVLAVLKVGLDRRKARPRRKRVPFRMPQTEVQVACLAAIVGVAAAEGTGDAPAKQGTKRPSEGGDEPAVKRRKTIDIFA
jgi:protein-tyrosine phosphatase